MTVPNDCSQLGREVEISQIEVELKRLWEADEASTNASLINFAVYSENAKALSQNSETVREITRQHSCRAILIGVDQEDSEVSMRAWITAHCNLMNGNKSVCSEQIAFHLTGQVSGRLSNTVFAHLNSDLPLIFWWQGELSERFNDRLYSLIQRLVIDSSETVKDRYKFSARTAAINGFTLFSRGREFALNDDMSINFDLIDEFLEKHSGKTIFIFGFTFVSALVVWFVIKLVIGIRLSEEDELIGADKAEIGIVAYPEFNK